jgi:hypothetical protein
MRECNEIFMLLKTFVMRVASAGSAMLLTEGFLGWCFFGIG